MSTWKRGHSVLNLWFTVTFLQVSWSPEFSPVHTGKVHKCVCLHFPTWFLVKPSLSSSLGFFIFFSLILKAAIKVICVPLVFSYLTAEAEPETEKEPAAATPVPDPCSHPAFRYAQQLVTTLGTSLPLVRFTRQSKLLEVFSGEGWYCLSFCRCKLRRITHSFFPKSPLKQILIIA